MKVTVRFEGGRALEANLKELGRGLAISTARRALLKAAAPIQQAAQANAPRHSGHLQLIVGASTKLTKRQRALAGKAATYVGTDARGKKVFKSKSRTGVEVYVGPTTDAENFAAPDPAGLMVEFGTARQLAEPFLRPAWEAGKAQALETIRTELAKEIDKTAKRLARRRSKG